ncbi:MAG: hypothetical protein JW941_08420 [Candidatus Coatesbacteria bacterium]|nr:hypothetical protein [Candidatus Coatesbacteria bacterium]
MLSSEIVRFYPGMPQDVRYWDEAARTAILGAKGAGLVRMCELEMPCPQGFIIPTLVTENLNNINADLISSFERGETDQDEVVEKLVLPDELWGQICDGIHWLEERTGKEFGNIDNPLHVSVRSGGTISLPGLMETVCNVGVTGSMLERLDRADERWNLLMDCYRRFIEGYGSAVLGIDRMRFGALLKGQDILSIGRKPSKTGQEPVIKRVPDDHWETLRICVMAVILSAKTPQVKQFMRTNYIRESVKTAVTIQRMVFGNLDRESGSGVVFSRNPSTGKSVNIAGSRRLFGQIIVQSQGDDVVRDLGEESSIKDLESSHPGVCEQLTEFAGRLETDSGYVQDIEFTLESGRLYLLQARPAKMAPSAFLLAQLDMIEEGIASEADVIARTDPRQLEQTLSATVTYGSSGALRVIGQGSPLVPGYASGRICFDVNKVRKYRCANEPVIFCCDKLQLSHIPTLEVVDGIISSQKNVLSHATLNARYLGRPSIVKASVVINPSEGTIRYKANGIRPGVLREGDIVSIDAQRGLIYEDRIDVRVTGVEDPVTQRFCDMVKDYSDIKVYAQAEDNKTYATAKRLGADGVANFRTDVLFFKKRINFALCDYVLKAGTGNEHKALATLRALLEKDFIRIFQTIDENYIAIRLCKHTMYEYLPKDRPDLLSLAEYLIRTNEGPDADSCAPLDRRRVEKMVREIRTMKRHLEDYNPILGRRGVRLATTLPQIYEVELGALFSAMKKIQKEGKMMKVDVLVPFISVVGELLYVRKLADRVAAECGLSALDYVIAPEIEISGIAFEMDKIACHTNLVVIRSDKLTTSTHHIVREDAEAFLGKYVDRGWFYGDPFRVIQLSTERLVRHAVEAAKRVNPDMRILVAGTHCSNEYSLHRLLDLGITEICCPPIMVPVAKLIAAKVRKARS